MAAETARSLFYRAMRAGADGRPLCGSSGTKLGARKDLDIPCRADGAVAPHTGGMSVTPDDPAKLPEEFRPESLGGLGRLPVFMIAAAQLGMDLRPRVDPKRPQVHAFVEPERSMLFDAYQSALCASSPN
jgi:hypothetical protein